MERSSTHVDPEAALGQRDWLRRVARELLGDASAADDLAQEAWLAARGGPARPGPRGPWMRGVLRRLARQKRRETARRTRRERAGARAESLPPTAELVQRAELQRRVAAAVVALHEPYRTTVLLRYFDDLSAAEIARRQGVPTATVRSRLARGLAQLRGALDAERPEGRAAWAPLMASWLGEPALPVAAGATLLGGVLTMKAMLVAGAATLAAIGLWWVLDGDAPSAPVAAISAEERGPAEDPPELPDEQPAPAKARAALGDVEPAPSVQETAELAAPTAPRRPAVVEARVLDGRGAAPRGASLTLRSTGERAPCDAAGHARLELMLPLEEQTAVLVARAPGFAARHVEARLGRGATTQLGELVLGAAGTLRGRVVGPAGAPLADVQVLAGPATAEAPDPGVLRRHGPRKAEQLPRTTSAADGSFVLAGVPAGQARAWAGGERHAWSSVGPLEVAPDEELGGLELVVRELAREERIAGVLREPDGAPVPRAAVLYQFEAAGYSQSAGLETDDAGRFELLLSQRVPHDFHVRDPEERYADVLALNVQPGTLELELRFVEPRWIAVQARDEAGRVVRELRVQAQHRARGYPEELGQPVESDPESGVAQLLAPSLSFEVVVDAKGFALATLGPFEPVDAPAELVASLVELPGVSGVVLDDGAPVAGASVRLERVLALDRRYLVDGFRSRVEPSFRGSVETDADGRFHIDLRDGGEYILRAEKGERPPAELGPLRLEPEDGARGLELALPVGGAIEGRLVLADGGDPAGRVVGVNHGDGRPITKRADAEGRFRFEGLAPGMWQVLLREEERVPNRRTIGISTGPGDEPLEWSCEVLDGETTWFDLIEEERECLLEGRFALGDAPLAGWSVELTPPESGAGGAAPAVAELGADGSFRLSSPRAGTHELSLRAPAGERGGLELRQELELREGANEWSVELPAGALTGEGAVAGERVETTLEYRWSSTATAGLAATARLVPDAAGRFALALVPAGEARVMAYSPGDEPGLQRGWTERARAVVQPGASGHVVLP